MSKKPPTLERSFSERRKPIRDENCPSIYTRWRPDAFRTTFWTCFTASDENVPDPLYFWQARTDLRDWQHVWKMDAPRGENRDIIDFAEKTKASRLML